MAFTRSWRNGQHYLPCSFRARWCEKDIPSGPSRAHFSKPVVARRARRANSPIYGRRTTVSGAGGDDLPCTQRDYRTAIPMASPSNLAPNGISNALACDHRYDRAFCSVRGEMYTACGCPLLRRRGLLDYRRPHARTLGT